MNEEVMYVDEQGREVNPPQHSMAPPMAMQQSDKADLLEKIRPDLIVEIIRNRLLGKELINGEWVTQPYYKIEH